MEELIIGTIIKLHNDKEYIVADSCKINSVQYVILTNNEESDEEEIFVLKNCKDKDNQYFLQSSLNVLHLIKHRKLLQDNDNKYDDKLNK